MSVIKQTNRTILFEVFNTEKLNLIDLVGVGEKLESLTDEKIREIDKHLLVRNFKEFLEKFEPKIYSYYNTETHQLHYQLERPVHTSNALIREIVLNEENDFMRMLLELIKAKQQKKQATNMLPLDEILKALLPEKNVEKLCLWRHQIRKLYAQSINVEHKEELFRAIKEILHQFGIYYGDVASLLPLLIEDIKTSLILEQKQEAAFSSPLLAGILSMSQEGELSVLEVPKQGAPLTCLSEEQNKDLAQFIQIELKKLDFMQDTFLRKLVLDFFCPLKGVKNQKIDLEEEVLKYNTYLKMYKESCEAFSKVVKPVIENILGVYFFFDQYKVKKGNMPPTLLVINIPSKQFLNPKFLKRLKVYLNTTNAKNDFTHTVWMSIIPSIPFEQKEKFNVTRIRFTGNPTDEKEEISDTSLMELIMEVMHTYKIQTYFSFNIGEKTSFQEMKRNGNQLVIKQCKPFLKKVYSEFLIPCYPNFTLIPKENSCIKVGEEIVVTDENKPISMPDSPIRFWLGGLYIKASYVAAGLVAAYQCPTYLETIYDKKQVCELPGVRYDIEREAHALQMITTLPKENPGLPQEIKEELMIMPFGFLFSSDNVYDKGKLLDKITVFNARSLYFDGTKYEPLYKTLVANYIERILRYESLDFKKDRIPYFFSSHPMSQKSQWLEHKEAINAILGEKDSVTYSIEEEGLCHVIIVLNDERKELTIKMREEEV